MLVVTVYLLGVAVQLGLKRPLKALASHTVRRVPLVGDLYSLADRFVALWHEKQEADIGAMRPVWCFFGGEGTAVLALAPSAQEIEIEGRSYLAVLVPTAPVPFGGALIYVPHDWVRPATLEWTSCGGLRLDGDTPPRLPVDQGLADPTKALR